MFPVRHGSYPKKILMLIPVGTGGAKNWCRTVCFWSVVMATIFRKPGVCLSASWNHSLLNSFVPEEPLYSQLLHIRLASSHWFPASPRIISPCSFPEPSSWRFGFAVARLAHPPAVRKAAYCDLFSTRNLEGGDHLAMLTFLCITSPCT